MFALVAGLFVSLAMLVWRTGAATWLGSDNRSKILWVMVVGHPQNVFTLYASYARYFFSNNGSGLMLY